MSPRQRLLQLTLRELGLRVAARLNGHDQTEATMLKRGPFATFAASIFLLACQEPPPRVPVSDRPVHSSNTCHTAGSSCNYNADCCSGRCQYEMETCRE
jgi:hypothetical protein